MKKFVILISIIITGLSAYAQQCDDKELCDKDLYGKFDYRSQSNYVYVYTGDTIRVKVVIYSGQTYRIFTCAERRLKDVSFRIIFPEKRFERSIKEITKQKVPIYEKNKNGEYMRDSQGNRIHTGTIFAKDTVWGRDLVTTESIVYNSEEAENKYWEASIHKTRLIIIETIIPEAETFLTQRSTERSGCIQIMVGRKYKSSSQFRR